MLGRLLSLRTLSQGGEPHTSAALLHRRDETAVHTGSPFSPIVLFRDSTGYWFRDMIFTGRLEREDDGFHSGILIHAVSSLWEARRLE